MKLFVTALLAASVGASPLYRSSKSAVEPRCKSTANQTLAPVSKCDGASNATLKSNKPAINTPC